MGLPGARSVEKRTEMVEPAATSDPVGETDTTVRAAGGAVGVAAAWLKCRWSVATRPAPATTSTARPTVRTTHQRGPLRRTCSPDMTAAILPGTKWA